MASMISMKIDDFFFFILVLLRVVIETPIVSYFIPFIGDVQLDGTYGQD
jgi:hypothetical protein